MLEYENNILYLLLMSLPMLFMIKCSLSDTHAIVAVSKRCGALRIGNFQRPSVGAVTISPHASDVQRRTRHVFIAVCQFSPLHTLYFFLNVLRSETEKQTIKGGRRHIAQRKYEYQPGSLERALN